MRFSTLTRLLTAAACLALVPAASAQLAPYSQDFESLPIALDPTDFSDTSLADDGWLYFGEVYQPNGSTLLFTYGPLGVPNTTGESFAFCGVKLASAGGPADSHVTPDQGLQHFNIANDYQNPQHANGSGNVVSSTVYQTQTIGAGNVGQTWTFSFDATLPNTLFNFVGPDSLTNRSLAFLRIQDPGDSSVFIIAEFDASNLNDTDWVRENFSYEFNGSDVGKEIQFGFVTRAVGGSPTGTYYDNIAFYEGLPPVEPEPTANAVPMPLGGLIALGALLGLGGFAASRRRPR